MFNSSLSTSIWMGELDYTMDEPFITNVFDQLGQPVVKVTMLDSSRSFGIYGNSCFIEFSDVDSATDVLQRLSGKYIPGRPGKKFKLCPASYDQNRALLPEFSLHVADLSWNIDDYQLYSFFEKKYKSVRGGKVIKDAAGKSKCFGFVRFSEESEQLKALIEMQHMTGLGRKPIKLSIAKKPAESTEPLPPQSHQSNYYSWGGMPHSIHDQSYPSSAASYGATPYQDHYQMSHPSLPVNEDAEVLQDPELEINVGKENREYIESSESFFCALENSRWQPLDNIMSKIPG